MEKTENKENSVIQSQKTLYTKFQRINRLFKIHFSSLILLFVLSLGYIFLWTYFIFIAQTSPEIFLRYSLFRTIVTIVAYSALSILIIVIAIQILLYGSFMLKGNRSLKQTKREFESESTPYDGVVPYITNFYAFFNRYSKKKKPLVNLVRTFLFFNVIPGYFVIILFSRFLRDTGRANDLLSISMDVVYLILTLFWVMIFITSFKINKEIVRWESIFPKLEEWAKELEQFTSESSILSNEEGPP